LKIAAIEFVAVLLELSTFYQRLVLQMDILHVLVVSVDSIKTSIAVRLLNGIEKAISTINPDERSFLLNDLICLFENSPYDMDDELAFRVQGLKELFTIEN
jgi:hypothetical protein